MRRNVARQILHCRKSSLGFFSCFILGFFSCFILGFFSCFIFDLGFASPLSCHSSDLCTNMLSRSFLQPKEHKMRRQAKCRVRYRSASGNEVCGTDSGGHNVLTQSRLRPSDGSPRCECWRGRGTPHVLRPLLGMTTWHECVVCGRVFGYSPKPPIRHTQ